MAFEKATKKQSKLRMAITGPSGTGKTYSSLVVAKVLGAKTAVIDSERGSASKYSHLFDFYQELPPDHSLERYIRLIEEAGAAGFGTLIIDTLSHTWSGKGGALETVDRLGGASGNEFVDGWGEVTPVFNRLLDCIASYPGHVIATFRMKTKRILVPNKKGKLAPQVVGLVPVFREGVEHEFDVFAELDTGQRLTVRKDRSSSYPIGARLLRSDLKELSGKVLNWLNEGSPISAPAATAQPAPTAPAAPKEDDGFNTAPKTAGAALSAAVDGVAAAVARLGALLPEAKSTADMDRIANLARKESDEVKKAFRGPFNKRLDEITGGTHASSVG